MCNLARKVTHARKRKPWAHCDELLHRCRGPRRNHLGQFLWLPHTGFQRGGGGGQILGFSIDLHRRPYNTLALPCECVVMILTKFWFCRELAHLCRCHAVNVYLVSIYWSGSWHNKNGRSQSLTLLYNFCHQNPSRSDERHRRAVS